MPGNLSILRDIFEDTISADLSSEDSADVGEDISARQDNGRLSEEYACLRGAYVFQSRRYAAFFRWAAHIDAEMEEDRAYASTKLPVRAAALSSNIFDYYRADVDWYYWGNHVWSYSAGVTIKVYAFHNFVDKKDYYVVNADGLVKPDLTDGATEIQPTL